MKKRRQGRVESVAVNPDKLENSKEAGRRGAQGTHGLSKNCRRQVERVYPLCRVCSQVFVINIIDSPLGG